jgi:lipoyl(octanoyl) transferase
MNDIRYYDSGLFAYQQAWDFQEELFQKVLEAKNNESSEGLNYLIFCEHPHVYTLGKSGSENNLLIDHLQLMAKNAEFFKINRGGDITYHGPGQLVGYPIINLEQFKMGVKEYVHNIEEAIICTLKEFDISATRLTGATGVWLDVDTPRVRKICAIGVRVSRSITMHGFAFNINTDLNYFNFINPCGFTDKAVTSLEKELGKKMNFEAVKDRVKHHFGIIFNASFIQQN